MEEALFHELLAASRPEEKDAIVAEAVLSALPEDTALVARSCCLFHWFDEAIVEALAQDSPSTRGHSREIYGRIASLPFVEPLPWGVAMNSSAREALLSRYSATNPAWLKRAASLAIPAYRAREADGTIAAEAFFCAVVAGELTTAHELLDSFRQRAPLGSNQKYFRGLRQLVDEAEQLTFVHDASLRKALEGGEVDPTLPSPKKETALDQLSSHKPTASDKGTSFSAPGAPATPARQGRTSASPGSQASSSTPTVLVVEDSPTVRKILQVTLQRERIRVITASDASSALTLVADEMPALILLDDQLPRIDGYTLCQMIRKNLQFRAIPIIMLSKKDGTFDKMRARLAGVTEYLTKPFNSAVLIQTVAKYLGGWQEETSSQTTSPDFNRLERSEHEPQG